MQNPQREECHLLMANSSLPQTLLMSGVQGLAGMMKFSLQISDTETYLPLS